MSGEIGKMLRAKAFADDLWDHAGVAAEIAAAVRRTGQQRVVLIGSAKQAKLVLGALARLAADVVVQVSLTDELPLPSGPWTPNAGSDAAVDAEPFASPRSIYERARNGSPLAAVADLRNGPSEERRKVWRLVMLTLGRDGAYIVRKPGPDDGSDWTASIGDNADDKLAVASGRGIDRRERRHHIVMVKTVRHVLRIGENTFDRMHPLRCPEMHVDLMDRLPARDVVSLAMVRHHGLKSPRNFPTEWTIPQLSLRKFDDVIYGPWALTMYGETVLPPSFRYPFHLNPSHLGLDRIERDYATLRPTMEKMLRTVVDLPGCYFDASGASPHHFGHWLTEVPAKLWGWHRAKECIPSLKALVMLRPGQTASFEVEILRAYGIAESDIMVHHGPARVETLVSATQGWGQIPQAAVAHPMMTSTWRLIGDELDRSASVDPMTAKRVFLTRTDSQIRTCHQREEVERHFEGLGFEVLRPELLTLGDQVRLIRSADVVAGFAGSQMFNLIYATGRTRVMLIASPTYTARHEHLITSLLGNRVDYFWGVSDEEFKQYGDSQRVFESNWSFDVDKHADKIAEVLAE